MGIVVSVMSGKGGVGKTYFSANISAYLAKIGYKVLAIDFDIGLRNLDLVLGMANSTIFDFSDVIKNNVSFDKAITEHPIHRNLFFLNAPQFDSINNYPVDTLKNLTSKLKNKFDFIIVDCPAGLDEGMENAILASDKIILISTFENTAIRDCERLASILYSRKFYNASLVINRINAKYIEKGYMLNIDDIIDSISVKLIGILPEDKSASIRSNLGKTVVDEKNITSKAFKNIAIRLSGVETPLLRFWK